MNKYTWFSLAYGIMSFLMFVTMFTELVINWSTDITIGVILTLYLGARSYDHYKSHKKTQEIKRRYHG